MIYGDYINQIATMAVVPSNDPNFLVILPEMINYAELRIQRDLDLFAGVVYNTAYNTSANSETVTIQQSDFITIQSIQLSTYGPLLPVSNDWMFNVYGLATHAPSIPKYYSMFASNQVSLQGGGASVDGLPAFYIKLAPTPNASYQLRITGTLHTQPLSSSNTTTWISTYLPDLFIMASMIFISAYQRNFGRINDDPQMAQTYESQYQALLKGAVVEEARKKFQSSGWTSMSPSPVATPSR